MSDRDSLVSFLDTSVSDNENSLSLSSCCMHEVVKL